MSENKESTEQSILMHQLNWRKVDDGVMGGISSTQTITSVGDLLLFEGNVSLENNGGFCSIQAPLPKVMSKIFTKVEIGALGDGKRYQCRILVKESPARFTANFTPQSDLETFSFNVNEFVPQFRGRVIRGMPSLPSFTPEGIAILIADKQKGFFSVSLGKLTFSY